MIQKNNTKIIMAGLVLAIVLSGVLFLSLKTDKVETVQTQTSAMSAAQATIAVKQIPRQASQVQTPNQTKIIQSYANTGIDGNINIDANGQVIIDTDLKNLFDYFMIATGELSLAEIRQELIKYAQHHLTTAQMQQLLAIYDKYQNYLLSQNELDARMSADLNQQQRLQILAQFRQDLLGSEMAEAFFAEDEGYAAFVLNKKHLNDQSNGQAIEQQSQWLEAEDRATQFQDTVLENRRLAVSDKSSEEIQQLRIEKYGQDAALRLQELDTQRQQWQSTASDYFSQRQAIENQQSNISLEQLEGNYSPQQLKRLRALWRIKTQH